MRRIIRISTKLHLSMIGEQFSVPSTSCSKVEEGRGDVGHVSTLRFPPRSSNRISGFLASDSPTGFISEHKAWAKAKKLPSTATGVHSSQQNEPSSQR